MWHHLASKLCDHDPWACPSDGMNNNKQCWGVYLTFHLIAPPVIVLQGCGMWHSDMLHEVSSGPHHWHVTCDISQKLQPCLRSDTGNGIIGQNINKYLRSLCHPMIIKVGYYYHYNLGCLISIYIFCLYPKIIYKNIKISYLMLK